MASEDYATEGQIRRLYAVLHSIGIDPKDWKKAANIASYAKLTRAQCSAFIDELEAREAEQKATATTPSPAQLPRKPDEKEVFGARALAEAQRISEEQGRATAPATQPAVTAEPKPTVEDLIFKFIDILAKVTVAVEQEDRIPEREKGYGVKFVYYSVKHELENGKGGDHEEQA